MNRTTDWLSKRETPPSGYPAARCEGMVVGSGFDGVAALPILSLGGRDGLAHFLADRSGQEAAYRMRLPSRRFHQLLGSYAARSLKQIQKLVGLGAVAGADGFLRAFSVRPVPRETRVVTKSFVGRHCEIL